MQIALPPALSRTRSMTATQPNSARFALQGLRAVAVMLALGTLGGASVHAAESAPPSLPSLPPAPLAVDAAFASVASFESGKFVVKFDVLPGHYLYRDRFEMQANGQAIPKIQSPLGKVKVDPTFGRVEVYEQPVSLSAATQLTGSTELKLTFQGCSAIAGVCYPPTTRSFALTVGAKPVRAKEVAPVSLTSQFKPQVSQ